ARSTWTWRENSRSTVPNTTRPSSPRAHSCWAASCNPYARRWRVSAWAIAPSRIARWRATALTLSCRWSQLGKSAKGVARGRAPCALVGGHDEGVDAVADIAFHRLYSSGRRRARVVDLQRRAHVRRCKTRGRECRPDECSAGLRMERSGFPPLPYALQACPPHNERHDPLGCGADRGAAGENERRVPRAGVCRYRSAGVGRPRLALVQSHDFEPGGAGLFRPRTAADLCLQSRGGAARIP